MDNLVKVEGFGQVSKDLSNGAVISTDVRAFSAFKRRKKRELEQEDRINILEEKLNSIECALDRIFNKLG